MLGPFNMIHGSAKLFSQLRNGNIAHDTELWNSNYYMLLLSNYSRHIKTDTKMLSLFLKHLTYFIESTLGDF